MLKGEPRRRWRVEDALPGNLFITFQVLITAERQSIWAHLGEVLKTFSLLKAGRLSLHAFIIYSVHFCTFLRLKA